MASVSVRPFMQAREAAEGGSTTNPTLATYLVPSHIPLLATLLLILALLQGTSTTLTIAMRSPIASNGLASMVSIAWLGMYLLSATALVVSFGLNWLTWLVRYRLLLILVTAGVAFSSTWSLDPNLTIERSIHLIGTTLVAVYLGFTLPLTHILRVSALTLGSLMLASCLAAWQLPALSLVEYEGKLVWAGVMASKNTLGFWSAMTFLLLVSLTFWSISTRRRLLYLVFAGISLLCLYNSVSATSILAVISAGLVMTYLHLAFSLRLNMLAMVLLGLLVAALVALAFHSIDTAEMIGRSGDLTGRSEVWAQTWKLILQRPLTGYGYGTIWFPTENTAWIQKSLTDFSWTVFHAHNGLLQIASEIGIPLSILALVMIVQQLVELIYCQYQRQQPGVLFVLGFVIALLVSNYSEARLLVSRELYWILFIALPISMLQQVNLSASMATAPWRAPIRASARKATGLRGNAVDKLARAREQMTHKRTLKKRLYKRRTIKIINENTVHDDGFSDSRGQRLFTPSPEIGINSESERPLDEPTPNDSMNDKSGKPFAADSGSHIDTRQFTHNDNRDVLKRKLARRQRKTG